MMKYRKIDTDNWVLELTTFKEEPSVVIATIQRVKYTAPHASIGYTVRMKNYRYTDCETLAEAKADIASILERRNGMVND